MKIINLLCLFIISSCGILGLKTEDDIKRDEIVDTMSVRQEQNQKLVADQAQKYQQIEETFQTQNGKFDEIQHEINLLKNNQGAQTEQRLSQLETQISTMQTEQTKMKEILVQIEGQLNNQKTYLKKVSTGIAKISGGDDTKSTSTNDLLKEARTLSDKGKYKEASAIYDELLTRKEKGHTLNRIYHGMGVISYRTNKFDEGLTLFSKIYTQNPKSSLASNSLYFIGKIFLKQKKKEEAKATFTQLIEQYPKKFEVGLAKNELKDL